MKQSLILLLAIVVITLGSCRAQKTGCPAPKPNWGAEKVLDEMNKPKKGRRG